MKYNIIVGGLIENIIEADEDFARSIGAELSYASDRIGDTWPRDLEVEKIIFILQVKSEAGEFTTQVLQGLSSEYEITEREATAYRLAGYPAATETVPLPSSIQSEVNSKVIKGVIITATEACDTILAAATVWRTAQASLRDNRLIASSMAEVAVDTSSLDAVKTNWAAFIATQKALLL
jgi:hypothetical protein